MGDVNPIDSVDGEEVQEGQLLTLFKKWILHFKTPYLLAIGQILFSIFMKINC